jgi:hypothetical protein
MKVQQSVKTIENSILLVIRENSLIKILKSKHDDRNKHNISLDKNILGERWQSTVKLNSTDLILNLFKAEREVERKVHFFIAVLKRVAKCHFKEFVSFLQS